MKTLRAAILFAVAAGFAAAILFHEDPGVMAVGFAPIAWLALEGCWRLFGPRS
jgi:hypothetical protein